MEKLILVTAAALVFGCLLVPSASLINCPNISTLHQVNETTENGTIIYQFPGTETWNLFSKENDFFGIRNNSLYTKTVIDFEGTPRVPTFIRMSLRYNNSLNSNPCGFYDIFLRILPINEFPPTFSGQPEVNISENTLPDTQIINLAESRYHAEDKDWPKESILYDLTNSSKYFEMPDKPKGIIRLKKKLSYDQGPKVFNVTILAKDSSLTSTTSLMIFVTDEDTRPPIFTHNIYSLNVKENDADPSRCRSTTPNIRAYDGDTGINATISYRFSEKNVSSFQIDAQSGCVKVIKPLDRETKSLYLLMIEAYQKNTTGMPSAISLLKVTVEDVNDNRPVFDEQFYNVLISENSPVGTYVVNVRATDKDQSPHDRFTYVLYDHLDTFHLNSSTGSLTVKNSTLLDREKTASVSVELGTLETDGHAGANTTITITLGDINDNKPIFAQPGFLLTARSLNKGSYIGRVTATDADTDSNGDLRYKLSRYVSWMNGASPIAVDPISGNITALLHLSKNDVYRFFLQACDSPHDQSFRRCALAPVQILASASKGTLINSTVNASVNENAAAGQAVIDLAASYSENSLQFRLISNAVPFNATKSGIVKVAGLVDYESKKLFTLDFLVISDKLSNSSDLKYWPENFTSATSSLSPGATANWISSANDTQQLLGFLKLNIHVKDMNDNYPKFSEREYTFSVSADIGKKAIIGSVKATDEDVGDNGKITYELMESDSVRHLVSVDRKTGQIRADDRLTLTNENNFMRFVVIAKDGGLPRLGAVASVKIVLNETDDIYLISTSLHKQQIENSRATLESNFTMALGFKVEIRKVDVGVRPSLGQTILFLGSTIHIAGRFPNGSRISAEKIKSAVRLHKSELQQLLGEKSVTLTSKRKSKVGVIEVSLIVIASLLFVCSIICIFIICKKHHKEMRARRLIDSLTKGNSLYESQELKLEIGDETLDYYKCDSLNSDELLPEVTVKPDMSLGIINVGYQPNGFVKGVESDTDSGHGNSDLKRTDPQDAAASASDSNSNHGDDLESVNAERDAPLSSIEERIMFDGDSIKMADLDACEPETEGCDNTYENIIPSRHMAAEKGEERHNYDQLVEEKSPEEEELRRVETNPDYQTAGPVPRDEEEGDGADVSEAPPRLDDGTNRDGDFSEVTLETESKKVRFAESADEYGDAKPAALEMLNKDEDNDDEEIASPVDPASPINNDADDDDDVQFSNLTTDL